jgi:hypothetical protein
MTIIAKPWLKKFVTIGQSLVDIKKKNTRKIKREKMKKKGRKKMRAKDRGGASIVKAHYMSIKCCRTIIFVRF